MNKVVPLYRSQMRALHRLQLEEPTAHMVFARDPAVDGQPYRLGGESCRFGGYSGVWKEPRERMCSRTQAAGVYRNASRR